jgi:hypothetical protein
MIEDPIKKPFNHILRTEKQMFQYWYDRSFLQSPSLCALKYDDEKMWEAWKAGQKSLGQMLKDNAELGKQK